MVTLISPATGRIIGKLDPETTPELRAEKHYNEIFFADDSSLILRKKDLSFKYSRFDISESGIVKRNGTGSGACVDPRLQIYRAEDHGLILSASLKRSELYQLKILMLTFQVIITQSCSWTSNQIQAKLCINLL